MIINNKIFIPFLLLSFLCISCQNPDSKIDETIENSSEMSLDESETRELNQEFKAYWFDGTAEITSYQLSQERYGEIREGSAVTIFVTEDFLPEVQVKANEFSEDNTTVLKLNLVKKFNTGIYPYSIMTSVFNPIYKKSHALKISNSVQEWCGQVYMQLNNRKEFEFISHSYFQGEADESKTLEKNWLEDELWNLLRINPAELPTGDINIIPSFEYLRLRHKPTTAYEASVSLKQGDSISIYTINYPVLERELTLYFKSKFPFDIEKWEETNGSTNTSDTLRLKTTAIKIKTLKTAYWQQNSEKFAYLRDSLKIK